MPATLVSVIIPTYNGAHFLGRAIQSVLNQTYSTFELIIVDDKSPDNTAEVVKRFDDPRLKYIRHEVNQGAATARGTGRHSSFGEIIAFLDQDDAFHPEKLEEHVAFLNDHPDIGFTYNPYFDLVHSSDRIRTVIQPPENITLTDLIMGFPLPPSSWVVRRGWAFHEDIWDMYAGLRGREIVVCGRLFLSGCKFACVGKALQYRGYHAGRKINELEKNCNDELKCQEIVFSDYRCPKDLSELRPVAAANIFMMWANVAFNQSETELGRKFLKSAIQLNPSLLSGKPPLFIKLFQDHCVDDESQDYKIMLDKMISQLSNETPKISQNYFREISRGYLVRGVRAFIWGRKDEAEQYISKAFEYDIQFDDRFAQQISKDLVGYEVASGETAMSEKQQNLYSWLEKVFRRRDIRRLRGEFLFNRAIREYRNGQFGVVVKTVLGSIVNHPPYLLNRGLISVFLRSVLNIKSL